MHTNPNSPAPETETAEKTFSSSSSSSSSSVPRHTGPRRNAAEAGPSGEAVTQEALTNEEPGTKNEEPPRNGRPPFDQAAIVLEISAIIAIDGLSDSAAARRAGVGSSTIGRWKNENPDIAEQFATAREEFRSNRLAVIRGAKHKDGSPNWRAAAWELERVFPEDYARRPGRRMEHHETHLPPLEELRAFARAAEQTGASYERLIAQHNQLMWTAKNSAAEERKRTEQALAALHQMYEQARLYALSAREPEPQKPPLLANFTPPPPLPEPDHARLARQHAEYIAEIRRKWEAANPAEAARMRAQAIATNDLKSPYHPVNRPAEAGHNTPDPSQNSQNPSPAVPKNTPFPSHNSRNLQPDPFPGHSNPFQYSHVAPDDDDPATRDDGPPGLHA